MRIGVIGTGVMGKNHLRVVHSIPEMQLTCAADINHEKLNAASGPYNLKKYNDYQEMKDQVDAVVISTPTIHHYPIARYFLQEKKHVLLENSQP